MSRYISKLAAGLQPYVPGKQPRDVQNLIKINTNENPYPPAPAVLEAIRNAANDDLRLYPDPTSRALREAIAMQEGCGLTAENIFVGNGSDEVLAFCYPAFFAGKEPVCFADVTYSFYKVYCRLFGVEQNIIPLSTDYSIDVDSFCTAKAGGVLLPNPNAPTGMALELRDIERILAASDCVVVIDEAYIAFGADCSVELLSKYDNLLIVRTLSKSHSLAGMRLGYAIGSPELIDALTRAKDSFNSYPVDRVAMAAGIAAMQSTDYYARANAEICATRDEFIATLNELNFTTLPSCANFVFTSPPDGEASRWYDRLLEKGILVRYFDGERTRQWLRISIASREDMLKTAQALRDINI